MYYAHFGLSEPPFKITPNTAFFFSGGNRGPILEALIYAISHGEGIVKVTGEVGSGKTMLCSMLEGRLPEHIETVYLANPSVSPDEILHAIAFELQIGLDPAAGRLQVMHALHDYLLARHAEGRRVVVFVEESQSMPIATLEEIRLLSNLETKTDKLLQIVLFGQPELDANLKLPQIRQLRERITHSFRLDPLNEAEVHEYLMFRLRAAGYRGPDLFSKQVVKYVARASAGLTRRLNVIADKALLAAFAENTHTIKLKHVEAAVRDSEFGREAAEMTAPMSGARRTAAILAVGAVLGGGVYALAAHLLKGSASTTPQVSEPVRPAVQPAAPANSAPAAQPAVAVTGPAPSEALSPRTEAPSDSIVSAGNAPEAGADLMNKRFAATRDWLAQEQAGTYTIQLLGAEDEGQLKNRLRVLSKSIEINKIFVYRTLAKNRPSVTVLYGAFPDRTAAREALTQLPVALKTDKPVLRTVGGIREELKLREPS